MTNEIEKSEEKKEVTQYQETSGEMLPHEALKDQVQEIISDLDIVKKEALEGFYLFKDLLANEGEASSATKEQMSSMLNLYLSTVETRLKAFATISKVQKESKGGSSSSSGGNNTNINILSGISRREMLKEIDKVVNAETITDLSEEDVEVVDDPTEEL